jgi:uncharacterized protein (DUF433 family)
MCANGGNPDGRQRERRIISVRTARYHRGARIAAGGQMSTNIEQWGMEDERIASGYPVVRGTRTPVRCLVEMLQQSGSFERTVAMFPHLTSEQVRGALDYYEAHPARVDRTSS